MKALITRKVGMTSLIGDDGIVTSVTLLDAALNVVVGKRTVEQDGYSALILGAGKGKHIAKPQAGMLKASKATPAQISEIRIAAEELNELNVGDKLSADIFSIGDIVSVSANSKGKGWAGTIKRHNFHRGRKTHGGRSYRRVGSIGSMYPQHILKGKKMAGRLGNTRVTKRGLKVAYVDNATNIVGVAGAVPGPNKGIVMLKEIVKS